MSPTWRPGDIGAETNGSFVARLIQFGQWLRPSQHGREVRSKKLWRWNHIFVVTDEDGSTIEAVGRGVVTGAVAGRDVVNLGCPPGVHRLDVVGYAHAQLGRKYNYLGVVLLGVDCLLGTKLHWHSQARFCSELGVLSLQAGGWKSPEPASQTKPADLVDDLLGTLPTTP